MLDLDEDSNEEVIMRFCWVCGHETEDNDGECSECQIEYHDFTE